ncbi:hypothetical protein KVT40_005358 [Elsinoe batatas]|uniref:Uncharacterized protein n=1 Tax=Elsinoe batatas TaxID=2601811 RepID=A0A8K0PGI8_9PEZI|nr:hypothetical protein KVT40_005358 [Elsinoe batatas]
MDDSLDEPRQSHSTFESIIGEHATRTPSKSLHPGNNYRILAEFLSKPESRSSNHDTIKERSPFALVYDLADTPGVGSLPFVACNEPVEFETIPFDSSSYLVFLRGAISPAWISTIAARFPMDPEFFQAHLHFDHDEDDGRTLFVEPALPSASLAALRFQLPTIFSRFDKSRAYGGQNLRNDRKCADQAITRYRTTVLREAESGDSVVRDYALINSRDSVIEQNISITFCRRSDESSWAGIAMVGKPELMDDPLYAVGEVISLVSHSENQFLNLLREQIRREAATGNTNDNALDNLRYFKNLVDRHRMRLHSINLVLDAAQAHWPCSGSHDASTIGSKYKQALKMDFKHLDWKAQELSALSEGAIENLVKHSVLLVSVSGLKNAIQIERLTLQATMRCLKGEFQGCNEAVQNLILSFADGRPVLNWHEESGFVDLLHAGCLYAVCIPVLYAAL